ncbi:GPI ethanolamine phosphate transferase 1-like [Schistocerca gregaria]|uniref:GPI ethanolamine phosphate transferase 1-like n=1 Tax=Schistocerca gregaria TaxID=7010 RepID=UPI00211ED382|nr:GPI ethanolamine phosphate transferase 1-like [Schistocerca gregaria]
MKTTALSRCVHILLFHLLYTFSAVDIYFNSMILDDSLVSQQAPLGGPVPADRVALIVIDGLRADLFLEDMPTIPYLYEIARERGVWGISHADMPTETRNGFIRILGGYMEDFNNILVPLGKDKYVKSLLDTATKAHIWSTDDHSGGRPISYLFTKLKYKFNNYLCQGDDEFVVEDTKRLFEEGAGDLEEQRQLNGTGRFFVFHMTCTDTVGHIKKPHSPEYKQQFRHVASYVKQIEEAFESYYGDDRTTFILTSDHGMNDRGAHGDGDPKNTETPFLAWGSGISKPNNVSSNAADYMESRIPYRKTDPKWKLDDIERRDMLQIDICPLVAYLLAVPTPANSIGILPLDVIDATPEIRTIAIRHNLQQLSALYQAKEKVLKQGKPIFFMKFYLSKSLSQKLSSIDSLIDEGSYDKALEPIMTLIDQTLEGIKYYDHYELGARWIVFAAYILFIIQTLVLYYACEHKIPYKKASIKLLVPMSGASIIYLGLNRAPWTHYFYVSFPVFYLVDIITNAPSILREIDRKIFSISRLLSILRAIAVIVSLVIGMYYRQVHATALALTGMIFYDKELLSQTIIFGISTLLLVALSFVNPNSLLHLLSSPLITLLSSVGAFVYYCYTTSCTKKSEYLIPTMLLVMGFIAASSQVISDTYIAQATHSAFLLRLNWILITCSLMILPSSLGKYRTQYEKLTVSFLSLIVAYSMLSNPLEILLYTTVFATCISWIKLLDLGPRQRKNDVALTYILTSFVSFFSPGNAASFCSFEIPALFRFVSTFFVGAMSFLIFLKVFMSFAVITVAFGLIVLYEMVSYNLIPLYLTAILDTVAVVSFMSIKIHGSWAEIGTSVFCFAFTNVFILCQTVFFYLLNYWLKRIQENNNDFSIKGNDNNYSPIQENNNDFSIKGNDNNYSPIQENNNDFSAQENNNDFSAQENNDNCSPIHDSNNEFFAQENNNNYSPIHDSNNDFSAQENDNNYSPIQ